MDIAAEVVSALERHPRITAVRLIGSRAAGTAGRLSDWDFAIDQTDFESVARDLPELTSRLQPIACQWDRLGPHATYMLMLPGPVKIDLLFLDQPNDPGPPWRVSVDTLREIDHHFWDWTLWLAAKDDAGKTDLVREELDKMSTYILEPLGVERAPDSVETAVALYAAARDRAARRLIVTVPPALEREVRAALKRAGYDV